MMLTLQGPSWEIPGLAVLDTAAVFAALQSETIASDWPCRSADHPQWRPLGERFRILGPYGILGRLGEGGYGEVFLAFRIGSSARPPRLLAIKSPSRLARQKRVDLGQVFSKEAALTARLASCPHVVKVLDHDVTLPYLALEYCDGGSLAERMTRPYGLDEVLTWGRHLAEALALAHGLQPDQLIHRDLKPENLLLHQGRLKVADFGTSKMARVESVLSTQRGGYTPAYAAPEAFEGRAYPGTDLWSFGVILYQLLSGRLPFAGETLPELLRAQQRPPAPLGPDDRIPAPPALRKLVMACLHREHSRRPSAAELRERLEDLAIPSEPGRRSRRLWFAAALLLPLLFVGLAVLPDRAAPPIRDPIRDPAGADAASPSSKAMDPALAQSRRRAEEARAAWQATFEEPPRTEADDLWHEAEELRRRGRRGPLVSRYERCEKAYRAAIAAVSQDAFARLGDLDAWLASAPEVQDRAIAEAARRLEGICRHVRTQVSRCGARATRIATFVHRKTGVELNLIPAGRFTMGDDAATHHKYPPVPSRMVEVRAPFLIGRTELSQEHWDRVGGADNRLPLQRNPGFPIVRCSWQDVTRWLSAAGGGLRLPSEAEWEYAARAGATEALFFPLKDGQAAFVQGRHLPGLPGLVGETRPNAFGLHDMLGNVWEWCQDDWAEDYQGAPGTEEPRRFAGNQHHPNRGGCFTTGLKELSCALRDRDGIDERDSEVGFRVALSIPAP